MAKLNIQRTNEYNNRMREYKIYIDNVVVGSIGNVSTKVIVEINDDETKCLKVGGFKYGKWLMPFTLILVIIHFPLTHFLDFDYMLIFSLPTFFLLLYYITIGRKKYLTLLHV